MKIKTQKQNLLNKIQAIQNVITTKNALPILSNILLEAHKDKLRLTATDLDIGITCSIPVNILEAGAITVPAKRFSDIVKELPEDEVEINTKKNNLVNIETKSCQFKLMGTSPEEFPKLPEFQDKEVIRLEQGSLKKMLTLTAFAVSSDETRYVLNGILLKMKNNNLTLVATDGRRLAIADKKLSTPANKEIQIIIPIKTIHELNRNLQEEGELSLVLGANQVLFEVDDTAIISRLIEGQFPDYQQVIPPVSQNKIKISRDLFMMAVRRAALLSTPDYQAVKIEVFPAKGSSQDARLVVSKSTPDVGESREELTIGYGGKEIAIGFNPYYLTDVLKNIGDESIEFEMTDSDKPGVLRSDGYVYIVLPMRLS